MKFTKETIESLIKEETEKLKLERLTTGPGGTANMYSALYAIGEMISKGVHPMNVADVFEEVKQIIANVDAESRPMDEALGPDDDYLDKLKHKQDYGVPNPEVAASKARTDAVFAAQEEIDKVYLDILKTNPEAEPLFDATQDYGYNNDYDLSGAEDMLQQFLALFPEGPVRERAKRSVTYFH